MPRHLGNILDKAIAGGRLSVAEGIALLESHDLASLGRAADAVTRRLHPEPFRTYNVDRNVNYTNVCTSGCRFCAFSRRLGDPDAYVMSRDELHRKIEETVALGGNQILLQGGMHPELRIEWYEELLRDVQAELSASQRSRFQPAGNRPSGQRSPGCRCGRCWNGSRRPAWDRCPAAGRKSSSIACAGRSAPARPRPTAGWRSAARGTAWADAARPP